MSTEKHFEPTYMITTTVVPNILLDLDEDVSGVATVLACFHGLKIIKQNKFVYTKMRCCECFPRLF